MKVQDILTSERKWCKHFSAIDGHGEETLLNSDAAAFCLYGAIEVAYGDALDEAALDEWAKVHDRVETKLGCPVADWNDAPARTFAEVRALIEELDI